MHVHGRASYAVSHDDGCSVSLPLVVVKGQQASLLGRDWLEKLKIDWRRVNKVSEVHHSMLSDLLKKYEHLFKAELGCIRRVEAKLHLEALTVPCFLKERQVSHNYHSAVENELDRLVEPGTIEPVQHSEWATPIVHIPKSNGTVRICGDYKLTVNKASRLAQYLLPRISDIVV